MSFPFRRGVWVLWKPQGREPRLRVIVCTARPLLLDGAQVQASCRGPDSVSQKGKTASGRERR